MRLPCVLVFSVILNATWVGAAPQNKGTALPEARSSIRNTISRTGLSSHPGPRANAIATYASTNPTISYGGGLFDLTSVNRTLPLALGVLNLSGDNGRGAVNLTTGGEVWRQAPGRSNDDCRPNMASSVKRVGPYFVVGWSTYSTSLHGGLNGLGKVCIYDAATGNLLNYTTGIYGGEWFGSTVEEVKDSQNPNRYMIAVTAPLRFSPLLNARVGAIEVFDIQDIVSQGSLAAPLTTIAGIENRIDTTFPNVSCSSQNFGTAIANAGDINGDGIDDFAITDPNYACTNSSGSGSSTGFTGRLFVYESSRGVGGTIGYRYSAISQPYYQRQGQYPRFGDSLAVIGTATETRAVMSGGFASIVFSIRQGGGPIQIRPLAYLDSGRPTGSRPGWTLTNIGDVDGDRIDDIASGNPAPGTPNSRIEFFSGADMVQPGWRWRRISSFSEFYTEDPYSLMGYGRNSVIGIPDMNGDGINEVAIGDMGTSEVFIVRP